MNCRANQAKLRYTVRLVSKGAEWGDSSGKIDSILSSFDPHPCTPDSSNLSFLIADEPIEFLSFQAQEVLPREQDPTLGCNGTGCVDIITCHHPDSNTSTLALQDGLWHLLDSNDNWESVSRTVCRRDSRK